MNKIRALSSVGRALPSHGRGFAGSSPVVPIFLLLFLLVGCANKVTRGTASFQKQIVFEFTVRGNLALSNPNVTYYIGINAPADKKDLEIDPASLGPRMNGPALNFGPQILTGRVPFTGLIPGDVESKWTNFYYLKGSSDGKGTVGFGRLSSDNTTPEIIQRNYPINNLWRVKSPSTFEVQIRLADLACGTENVPKNLVFNLATGDNIDEGGQGFVYDYWRNNLPFAIQTTEINSPRQDQDTNTQLIMRQIPGKPLPQLPPGVNPDDVNILSYTYRIIQ
jgi:hypothetical protein